METISLLLKYFSKHRITIVYTTFKRLLIPRDEESAVIDECQTTGLHLDWIFRYSDYNYSIKDINLLHCIYNIYIIYETQ